jgi:hypothetical protein
MFSISLMNSTTVSSMMYLTAVSSVTDLITVIYMTSLSSVLSVKSLLMNGLGQLYLCTVAAEKPATN